MIRNLLFTFALLLTFLPLSAQLHLEAETGIIFEGYNDVRIPNNEGTLFSFTDDFDPQGVVIPFRLRMGITLGRRHHISGLFAPLSIAYEGTAPRDIQFQNTLFEEGSILDGLYKFNSYRLTYRYEWVSNEILRLGLGLTAKIRDARIRLSAGETSDFKNDVGFVPLLHVFARYQPGSFALQLDGDGWAVSQGRAFDFALTGRYRLADAFYAFAGYRIVEGGADVDEVYNFTLINYAIVGISWGF
jgi:hypothetical protein